MDRAEILNRVLGKVIAAQRAAVRKTQKTVWEETGFGKTAYRDREQGAQVWNVVELKRVADVLDTTAWQLLKAAEESRDTEPPSDTQRAAEELRAALGFSE
ncbi:hypothetical protein [Nocardia niwae]|uniref:hypothetical protein n=1 Tax=Nocardia niwae TaxID=626084 RepID=UPI0007A50084|nr:hypothetical protein [Nocardia niwae]